MKPLIRWVKFNMIGAIGMVVQLCALAVFVRLMPRHYLLATAAAIELTLLHNFLWHLNLTWRDRRDSTSRLVQLFRFHLSNGLISLLGNLLLTRFFKEELHLPLLIANSFAILCCSVMNFLVSDRWAFAEKSKSTEGLREAAIR